MADGRCPIWGTLAEIIPVGGEVQRIYSPRAGGWYFITRTALAGVKNLTSTEKAHLSYWIWRRNFENKINGATPLEELPQIHVNILKEIKGWPVPSLNDRMVNVAKFIFHETGGVLGKSLGDISYSEIRTYGEIAKKITQFSVANEEALLFLRAASFCILGNDEHERHNELGAFLKAMAEENLIREKTNNAGNPVVYIELTPGGHRFIEGKQKDSKQAFVAMWFADSMNEVYDEAIKKAVEKAGYEPRRIDRIDHNNKIDDEIIAEIKCSRFIIADFTHGEKGMRGGVYYEAGFARGLGIEVIFTCHEDLISEIHFDTRQFPHIQWKESDLATFKKKLFDKIRATIGQGPVPVNNESSNAV